MQTLVYGVCFGFLMTGYLFCVVDEPSRLEERSQKMMDGWISQGKHWMLQNSHWKQWGRRIALPWETFRQKQKVDRAEKEIAQGISYLRNAAAMGRGEYMSTELLLSELAMSSHLLSDVYYSMANYLRLGDAEAALRVMEDRVKVPVAADYGRLLLQWEKLAPSLLMETLTSYQKTIEQVRLTKQKKWDELISDLVYFPVIMNVMLILINFIYVAYFIEQRNALLTMMG
ncbi:MAG: hypothetical protein IIW15_07010 [Firmicutes bacterium]|nr:hypothetical protein [Bacillota bacterium]